LAEPSPVEWSEAKFAARGALLLEGQDGALCAEIAPVWTLDGEAADPCEPAPEPE
jgi:hypothetical protein